VTKVLKAF